jgi:hypothetical protein
MSFERGIFTISIDVELAWGICDRLLQKSDMEAIGRERDVISRLLELFETYRIRATWAVVGHLFSDSCAWENGVPHPEIPRPVLKNEDRDWFFQHPKAGGHDPLWAGPDVVETISRARPEQEIASHSFAHMIYDETITNPDAIDADIRAAQNAHASAGLPFEVFIAPRGATGYRDKLSAAGIMAYRGNTPRWYRSIPVRPLQRLMHLLSFVTALQPPVVTPSVDGRGMIDVPESMLFMGRNGIRSIIPAWALVKKAAKGLERAAERKQIFHLWLHPSNFTHRTEEQLTAFESVLISAEKLRDSRQLEVLSIGDIARRVKCLQDCPISHQSES